MSTRAPALPRAQSPLSRRAFLRGSALCAAALLCPLLDPAAGLAGSLPDSVVTRSRLVLGTVVSISALPPAGDRSDERLEAAIDRAFARMRALESVLTRHDSAAPLGELRRAGRLTDAPADLCAVVERAGRFHRLTGGAFDITVAPVLELFQAARNPQGRMRLDPKILAEARQLVDNAALGHTGRTLSLGRAGMALTLDGIAKGHIVDVASQVLHQAGLHNHLINAGGDILARGEKAPGQPWLVGVADPERQGETRCTLPLAGAVATSGSAHMYFDADREHHHIIDPASGASPTHARSVSVTAASALAADALATALSVLPPQEAVRLASRLPGVECLVLDARGQTFASPGFGGAAVATRQLF